MLTEEDQPIEEFQARIDMPRAALAMVDSDFVVIERRSVSIIVNQPGSRARTEVQVVRPLNSQIGETAPLHLGPGLTMVSAEQWRLYQSHPPVAASLADGSTREVFSVQGIDAVSLGLTTDVMALEWAAERTSPDGPESSSTTTTAARARLARLS